MVVGRKPRKYRKKQKDKDKQTEKKKKKTPLEKKQRRNQIISGVLMLMIALTFVLIQAFKEDYKVLDVKNQYNTKITYTSSSAIINYTDETGEHNNKWFNMDYIEAFEFLNETESQNANVFCWWDYGHGIKGYAEKNPVLRNPSSEILYSVASSEYITEYDEHESIELVSRSFSETNNSNFLDILSTQSMEYVFVGKEDIQKASVMYNVSNIDATKMIMKNDKGNLEFTLEGQKSMIAKLIMKKEIGLDIIYEDEYVLIYGV